MPAQSGPLPVADLDDDHGEQQQRQPPEHYAPPPQPNGNHNHRHSSPPPPPRNDVEGRQVEEQEEDEDDEEEEEEDAEMAEPKQEANDDEEGDEQVEADEEQEEEEKQQGEDSGGAQSSSSEDEEKPEFVSVELLDIRKEVQCPICLGIIKKTRTVMECLHRFCRECIDKSMRMGNNECPACRTHCASRRSLRDDPNYDALIAALYPDIDKYEEEELAFHEEERTRNKQIQASIAQIFQRQSEALAKRRTLGKETSGPFSMRSQRNHRAVRRRRNSRGNEFQGFEENEEENEDKGTKDSSSTDEHSTEARPRRRRRRPGIRPSQPSTSADPEGGSLENDLEGSRENRGVSPGLVWNTEILAWGRGGTRSHTRHGNASVGSNKNSRSTRLSKLVEYLRSFEENNDEFGIHLKLIPLDQKSLKSLQQPYLCCRPSLSVKHLCEYVAHQTPLQAEEVEILLVRGRNSAGGSQAPRPSFSMDEPQILKGQETLAGLRTNFICGRDCLILAYRRKGD